MTPEDLLQLQRDRRSVRQFQDRPISRERLTRVLEAATAAPSATNRQPWRFTVVRSAQLRRQLYAAVRQRTEQMNAIVQQGHHAQTLGDYWTYFYQALETAAAIVVPQYRVFPDLIAQFIRSGGGDPAEFVTGEPMQVELCAASAAVMALLLQAHAEGLGACWMSGPMVARAEVVGLLHINEPWRMLGAIALGYPAEQPPAPARRPLERTVCWIEDEDGD